MFNTTPYFSVDRITIIGLRLTLTTTTTSHNSWVDTSKIIIALSVVDIELHHRLNLPIELKTYNAVSALPHRPWQPFLKWYTFIISSLFFYNTVSLSTDINYCTNKMASFISHEITQNYRTELNELCISVWECCEF